MKIPTNQLKTALRQGQTTYGIWHGLPDTSVAEVVASAGFDWVVIDGEHAPLDLRTILLNAQVMAAYDMPIMARPSKGDPAMIKQLLDFGIQTLIIPMVETAAQATEMVQAMRYPPKGIRGVGAAMARASRWNLVDDYLQTAEQELCLIVQVESARGYDNLEAILETDGIDGVFIGPSDLSASMGYLGQPRHPEMIEKISIAIELIRKHEKAAGVLALDPTLAEYYKGKGANMIGVGVDVLLLRQAANALASTYKNLK